MSKPEAEKAYNVVGFLCFLEVGGVGGWGGGGQISVNYQHYQC